jgi:hypothetical protein
MIQTQHACVVRVNSLMCRMCAHIDCVHCKIDQFACHLRDRAKSK